MEWNEADHPRDDDGKFVEKGGYEGLRIRRASLGLRYGKTYSEMPPKKNWQRVVDTLGAEDDLEYLDASDFRNELSREELLQHISERKASVEAIKQANQVKEQAQAEEQRKAQEQAEKAKREKLERIKSNSNATYAVAQKLLDVADRAYKAHEAAVDRRFTNQGSSGYVGKSKSVRATNAEADGKFTRTRAAEILGVSTAKIKEVLTPSEWHHTGALYNKSNYYDIGDICDIADDLAFDDVAEIRENYPAESIENFERIFGVKIK